MSEMLTGKALMASTVAIASRYRPVRAKPVSQAFVPCRWEGEILESCGCCSGHVRECLCEEHDATRCTRGPNNGKDADIASCRTGADGKRCRFYELPVASVNGDVPVLPKRVDSAWVRHLCFHVYPVAGNGVWRDCIADLFPYLPLFNGRRLVAIMTQDDGRPLDPPEEVEAALAGHGCDFVRIRNGPTGEVLSWIPLLSQLQSLAGPRQAAFWTHSKGVTHTGVESVHWWRRAMLETSLSDWPIVQDTLDRFPIAGSFFSTSYARRGGLLANIRFPWHYSGSMFWLRLDALFMSGRWRSPSPDYGGVEFIPGRLFRQAQAGKLFHPVAGVPALYDVNYWHEHLDAALAEWRRQRDSRRSAHCA